MPKCPGRSWQQMSGGGESKNDLWLAVEVKIHAKVSFLAIFGSFFTTILLLGIIGLSWWLSNQILGIQVKISTKICTFNFLFSFKRCLNIFQAILCKSVKSNHSNSRSNHAISDLL